VVFNISVSYSVPPVDAIEDIACAVRFARAKAHDYGGDPTTITLVGNSSGAAKGAIVAMDGDSYQGDCVVTEGSVLPDALVGYEGPFDYATHLYGTFDVPGLRHEDPEIWALVDPYSHIGGNGDLVVRLIHGRDNDAGPYDVPPDASAEFQRKLADAGYDVELIYVDGASHGSLQPGTDAFAVVVEQVLEVVGG
jgi:acetyl esterase/lipase